MVSKPPTRWTVGPLSRLRAALATFVAAGIIAAPLHAHAKGRPVRVLTAATVTDRARATMSPQLWAKFVAAYVGGETVSFAGNGDPTLEDCRKAAADYMLIAPFDLRPRLPGLPNATGRVAATTHLLVTNCITGSAVVNQTVDFTSDPPSSASDGDFESVPEVTWAHNVPATLAKAPLAFQRVAHVISVTPPLAFVDIRAGGLHAGDGLQDFARPDRSLRTDPIVMTVTQVFERYLEVMFSGNGERPAVGDLVEPLARPGAPVPAPLPSALPVRPSPADALRSSASPSASPTSTPAPH